MFDTLRNEYLRSLESDVVDSLNPKDLVTALRRFQGQKYLEIPVVIQGTGESSSAIPRDNKESLHNLNQGFISVGVSSNRRSDYAGETTIFVSEGVYGLNVHSKKVYRWLGHHAHCYCTFSIFSFFQFPLFNISLFFSRGLLVFCGIL